MISTFSNTAWVLVVITVLGLAWLAVRRTTSRHGCSSVPPAAPGLVCFATLTVLATALNDSGVQVTGMLLATALPVCVFLVTLGEPTSEPTSVAGPRRSTNVPTV